MKTCKDCYHFDACVDKLGTTKFYDNVIAANNVEDLCKTFKDKSLVLDLPCKVGSTVYVVRSCTCCSEEHKAKCVRRFDERSKTALMRVSVPQRTRRYPIRCLKLFAESFKHDFVGRIGKDVFLTRETAEQALKERKQV